MKSEDNLRPIPIRRRRYVFGALCLPLFGIVLAACGPDRPAATATASPTPSPTLDSVTEARAASMASDMGKRLYESELADANKALQTERNASNYCRRAGAYEGLGKYDEAIADCNLAIGLDPRNFCGYENRASVYHETGQRDLAIADYTKAISLAPVDPEDAADLYQERGKIHQELRRYDAAIADYTKALKLEPDDDELYYARGEAFYKKGSLAKAKADLNRCLQNSADTELIGKVRALLARIPEQSP